MELTVDEFLKTQRSTFYYRGRSPLTMSHFLDALLSGVEEETRIFTKRIAKYFISARCCTLLKVQ